MKTNRAEDGVCARDGRRAQTGLRAKFRELMDPARATWPRRQRPLKGNGKRSLLVHPVSWYTDGHLVKRPTNGAFAMAVFAEWCLAKVKAGHGGDLAEATAFYADTRRFMEMLLRNKRAGVQLRPKDLKGMAPRVARLVEQARSVSSKFRR